MLVSSSLLTLAFAVSALAVGPVGLSRRDVACTTEDGGQGVCISTSTACNGIFVEGACPSSANTECCVAAADDAAAGDAGDMGDDNVSDDGVIPEEESKRDAAAAAAAAQNGTLARRRVPPPGEVLYAAAARWIGTPYVWGGGNCQGPTRGGFDNSGLVLHAVCHATHKHLPHSAQRQYLSRLGRHIPRGRAERGDTVYWARNGDCRRGITHVALVKDRHTILHAPHQRARVREQRIWTVSGNLRICPYAVRFW